MRNCVKPPLVDDAKPRQRPAAISAKTPRVSVQLPTICLLLLISSACWPLEPGTTPVLECYFWCREQPSTKSRPFIILLRGKCQTEARTDVPSPAPSRPFSDAMQYRWFGSITKYTELLQKAVPAIQNEFASQGVDLVFLFFRSDLRATVRWTDRASTTGVERNYSMSCSIENVVRKAS